MFDYHAMSVELGRLILAALLGGAIGCEREYHGQAAGFRTNLLVTMGACLMMLLSLRLPEIFSAMDATSSLRIDPGRIASYAIAGMGFLGGGAIIKGRGSVRGLTTAASLWMVTGIGLAVGAGYYAPAVFTTVFSLFVLYNVRRLKISMPHHVYTVLLMKFGQGESGLRQIKEILHSYEELEIKFINFRQDLGAETTDYRLRLYGRERLPWGEIVGKLKRIPGLREIRWEEGMVP